MSSSIRLSPKHGLNPSMDICFWCGKPHGILLCGRIHTRKGDRTDIEAPHHMVSSLQPCAECAAKFKTGVHLIEVSDDGSRFNDNPRFALKDGDGRTHWPTGRYAVISPNAIKGGKAGGIALTDKETMDTVLAAAKK